LAEFQFFNSLLVSKSNRRPSDQARELKRIPTRLAACLGDLLVKDNGEFHWQVVEKAFFLPAS
jgi:hypothetical protein